MKFIIKRLRLFFSNNRVWNWIVTHDKTNLNGGKVESMTKGSITVFLDTRISISLWIEGKFNDLAATYMRYLKTHDRNRV